MNDVTERGQINALQYTALMRPLKSQRVAKRSQGGKQLSYLESWDVRAHLIRMFGFGNFDLETIDQHCVGVRDYMGGRDNDKEMCEAIWFAKVRLVIRDPQGREIARYTESAVGSTSGPRNMVGEHHDNAVKTAASDALKRCAINLGTQFGLSLYDNGRMTDVVRLTVVTPQGVEKAVEQTPDGAVKQLEESLGATQVTGSEASNEGHVEPNVDHTETVQA